ncbi:MAG: PAS domain S-box protein [Candidatus Stygibacter australis]|nr:PAS domain S-box protein [Candidatus Stygibacter australis]
MDIKMNLAQNQALKIFIASFLILFLAIVIIYFINYNTITENHLELSMNIANEISASLENNILEKVKTVRTISISPVILEALQLSNKHFGKLSEQDRDIEIKAKNDNWKAIEDHDNQFILKYTDNQVSKYLINLQKNIEGEYGEIFITDKYGALIASTAKLTTFAHNSKYWWKGAYNNGEGAVFFDDRGYDDSVGVYVVGVVVPIKAGNEIIGILKANLNILGSINNLILNLIKEKSEQVLLIRSGGLIVYKEGLEPLSKRIPNEILEKKSISENSFILKEEGLAGIYATSEIGITAGKPGYNFGGSFESIDHKKGNTGESWYIVDFHPMSHITQQINNDLKFLIFMGLFLSFVLAIFSMIAGNHLAKPIKDLIMQTTIISKGDFNSNISTKRTDEIGQLATSFNRMTDNLRETTTSIDNLNTEVIKGKKNEEALRIAAMKWQTTFDASQDVIMVLNEEHKIIQTNAIAKEIFGKPIGDMIGMSCHSIVHNSQKPILDCPFEQAKKSLKRESMELNFDNQWFEITVDPILDDNNRFIGAVHFIRDITNRKSIQNEIKIKSIELEKQFKKSEKQRIANLVILKDLNKTTIDLKSEISERKYAEQQIQYQANLLANVSESIFATDRQFNIQYWNTVAENQYGWTPAEVLGNHFTKFIEPQYAQESRKTVMRQILKEGFWSGELIHNRRDGTLFPVQCTISTVYDAEGQGIGHITITSDITNRKQAEKKIQMAQEEIKKLNEDLEDKVIERTKQLEASNKELEAFSYSISHDLRAPLRAINGFTKILVEDYGSHFDEDGKEITSVIVKNALKMGQLIDDLIFFTKIGRAAFKYSKIDMEKLIQSTYYDVTNIEEQQRIDFEIHDLENISGDYNMLKVVWTNLISNAVKFTANRDTAIIEIYCTTEEQYITYHIKDNGVGFDMKYVDKLFGVFHRLHTDEEFSGTGVGLALIKRIILQHKGKVWAKGELDKGAEFSFSLPGRQS